MFLHKCKMFSYWPIFKIGSSTESVQRSTYIAIDIYRYITILRWHYREQKMADSASTKKKKMAKLMTDWMYIKVYIW